MQQPFVSLSDDPELVARLAALADYAILDSAAEPCFDDVVALACAFCHTPIALVSLVERRRQWFKARIGMEACETPLEQSVCAHAMGQRDLLIIPDLTQDPRTRENTLVTRPPHIRFYAGAPLVSPAGVTIGTLCVIDTVPRPEGLTAEQAEALTRLARQVMALLDMRTRLLDRSRDMAGALRAGALSLARARSAEAAQEAGRIGTFELDVASGDVQVSAQFCRLFGLPVAPSYPAALLESVVVPQDREISSREGNRRDGSATQDVEYRIRRADDGALRWIGRRSEFVRDAEGRPTTMLGMVHDITERKVAAQRLAALSELSDLLRDATSQSAVLRGAAAILGRTLEACRVGHAAVDPAGGYAIAPGWTAPGAAELAGRWVGNFTATLAALRSGRMQVIPDLEAEPDLADLADYRAIGARAVVNMPLLVRGELTGVLFVHADAPRAWTAEEQRFIRNVSERVHATLSRLKAEAAQQMLNRELSHRLKNTLAMVQAIASQTLREVSPRGPVRALEQRIHALSAAHGVLLRHQWVHAPIHQVVEQVVQALGQDSRIAVQGPAVVLGQRSALSLAMLLHELGTNALKYGALSAEAGQVSLDWRLEGEGEATTLVMQWLERGGPEVAPPAETGFGSALIGMGLSGTGGVDLRYPPAGFEAEMRALLVDLQD